MTVHPIEVESYRILRSRVDTGGLPPYTRAVTERIMHATADLDYVSDLACDEGALERAAAALHAGAPIVVDAKMVAAGITARRTICRVDDPRARDGRPTRSAAGVRLAAREAGPGAIWVVGCAPTALDELISIGELAPTLVIGLPVGFVRAAEAKERLRASGLPALTNRGEKGGSSPAAAAVNALIYLEKPR
jgi:precorrin isomerase